MSQGTRAANQDSIDQVVIDTPTPVTDDIKCIVEEVTIKQQANSEVL